MKILLRGAFTIFTGYGNAVMNFASELMKGVDLNIWPTGASAGLPTEILSLFAKPIPKRSDIFLDFVDPGTIFGRLGDTYSVLFTMWESTKLTTTAKRDLLQSYDLIIVPNSMNQKVFAEEVGEEKVKVVPLCIDADFYEFRKREPHEQIRFCAAGNLTTRKGVELIIDAYEHLKKEENINASLSLRPTGPGLHPQWQEIIPDFHIYNGVWSREELRNFYYNMDVMLCPNRGEGFNLPAVEFLCSGGTVIASSWGGHQAWMSDAFAYPLDYKVEKIGHKWLQEIHPDAEWIEPNFEHLKQRMREVCNNREELVQKMLNARIVAQQFNKQRITKQLMEVLVNGYESGT